ncbi:hypothetical protein N0V82_004603 [Gnomoniopsis sp. IMI 355080]|nr:hypothetical protein N0V82_004603 [Gnomoniopsis sp. IMI 355080]
MVPPCLFAALLPLLFSGALGQQNFTVSNGQIFTPGFAIVDAPQPGTPLGGSQIEVALDVSADGVLPLNAAVDSPSRINNITIFMYSYDTGRNFTISNGTITNATYGPIMQQEPGSTVKHVKWTWPSCLVGNGQPTTADSARGIYNISIRQNFRMNNTSYYTIFDLPISVTNSIDNSTTRPDCDSINNPLMTPEQINATIANRVGILFAPGDSQIVQVKLNKTDPSTGGLGGAATLSWEASAMWMCGLVFAAALVL